MFSSLFLIMAPLLVFDHVQSTRPCLFQTKFARFFPRAHTPFRLDDPNPLTRCGYTQNGTTPQGRVEDVLRQPYVLSECTEPIDARGWDFRGLFQREFPNGTTLPLFTRYEQCGNRLVVTGGGVVHDQFITETVNGGTSDLATPGLPDSCAEFTAVWEWGFDGPNGERSITVRRTQNPSTFATRYEISPGLIGIFGALNGQPLPIPPLERRLTMDFAGNPIGLGNTLDDCVTLLDFDYILTKD